MDILEKKKDIDFVLIDTPGQIEVFTWSASGTIISDAIARSYPTVIAFIMDTVRFADLYKRMGKIPLSPLYQVHDPSFLLSSVDHALFFSKVV